MVETLKQNAPVIAIIIAVLVVGVFMWYNNGKKEVKKAVHLLVEEAEAKFGSKTGDVKYKYVVDAVYQFIPPTFKLFVSERMLGKLIEEGVKILKEKTESE